MGAGTYQRTNNPWAGAAAAGFRTCVAERRTYWLGAWYAGGWCAVNGRGTAYGTSEPLLASLAAKQGIKPAVEISERLPLNYLQGAAGLAGANVAMYGAQQVGAAGEAAITGQPYHISPTSALLDIASTGPFMALHLTKGGRAALGGRTSRERAASLQDSIQVAKDAEAAFGRTEETANKASTMCILRRMIWETADAESMLQSMPRELLRPVEGGGTTLGDEQR
jgi:hypothetical protein